MSADDPAGMYNLGIENDKLVTYDYENGWSANAPNGVQLIANAMLGNASWKNSFKSYVMSNMV